MKTTSNVAGVLLGFLFNFTALNYFFNFVAMPSPPEGSPPAMFLGAMITTGYFTAIKLLEIVGGILVAIPKTRALGLLALGPIVVNILLFHVYMTGGAGLFPLPFLVSALSLFLLWSKREAFAKLLS